MKICLLSASTKHIEWENYGAPDWFEVTSKNHLAYANKWDMDYISLMIDNNAISDRHATWLKIKELKRAASLGKWDWIVWIDADACIVNDAVNLEPWLTGNHDWVLPKMQPDPNHGICWTVLSTGLMAMRCSDKNINLLNTMWKEPGDFRYGGFHEQSWFDNHFKNIMSRVDNLRNLETEDLSTSITLPNETEAELLVLPYKWHLTTLDNEIPFVYHAGGNTPTKTERIKKALCI